MDTGGEQAPVFLWFLRSSGIVLHACRPTYGGHPLRHPQRGRRRPRRPGTDPPALGGLLRAFVPRAVLVSAAALGHRDDRQGRSRHTDRQNYVSEPLKAGHGFSHPRTLRPARCSTTEAPIHNKAPSTTVLGATRDGPRS